MARMDDVETAMGADRLRYLLSVPIRWPRFETWYCTPEDGTAVTFARKMLQHGACLAVACQGGVQCRAKLDTGVRAPPRSAVIDLLCVEDFTPPHGCGQTWFFGLLCMGARWHGTAEGPGTALVWTQGPSVLDKGAK